MADPGSGSVTKVPTAYIAFKTLVDLIDRMEREEPPTRVDPTYLDSYAGGYRPTVISNLQALGLLAKTGEPTETMLALVAADDAGRRELIGNMIRAHYSDILALGKNSTQGQFLAAFGERGVNGDTRRKAISFFLKACKYAGIPTGTHWKTPPASATGSKPRKAAVKNVGGETAGLAAVGGSGESGEQDPPAHDVAVVRLRSGGTLTLALSGNSLTMPKDDRNFVFGIVDLMQEYEEPQKAEPDDPEEPDDIEEPEET